MFRQLIENLLEGTWEFVTDPDTTMQNLTTLRHVCGTTAKTNGDTSLSTVVKRTAKT